MPELLIETVGLQQFKILHEESKKAGALIIEGEFGRCDVPTQNKRLYSRRLTEREVRKLTENEIASNGLYGELDHPSDGKTKFQRVSHRIVGLRIEGDGRVVGKARVLNTPNGRIIKAIVEDGGSLGVSSRGFGSVTQRQDGVQEVGEDFRLKTYDIVVDPAMKTARPDLTYEAMMEDVDWVNELKDEFPEVLDALREDVRDKEADTAKKSAADLVDEAVKAAENRVRAEMTEKFGKNLQEQLTTLRGEVAEELKEQFSQDPRNGGAVAILERVAEVVSAFNPDPDSKAVKDALKAKDRKIAKLTKSEEDWRGTARDLGFKLCLEREVGGHPAAKSIKSALGNMSQFKTLEDLKETIGKLKEDLSGLLPGDNDPKTQDEAVAVAEVKGRLAEKDEEITRLRDEVSVLQEDKGTLNGKLHRAVQIGTQLAEENEKLKNGAAVILSEEKETKTSESKLAAVQGYSNAPMLLKLLENVEGQEAIDRIVKVHGRKDMSDSKLEELRNRIARGTQHDGDGTQLEEEGVDRYTAPHLGMNITADEILTLAGEGPHR